MFTLRTPDVYQCIKCEKCFKMKPSMKWFNDIKKIRSRAKAKTIALAAIIKERRQKNHGMHKVLSLFSVYKSYYVIPWSACLQQGRVNFDGNGIRSLSSLEVIQYRKVHRGNFSPVKIANVTCTGGNNCSFAYKDGESESTLWPGESYWREAPH